MNTYNFERLNVSRHNTRDGGKRIARLDVKNGKLVINKKLQEQGFDVMQKYLWVFDKESRVLGLKIDTNNEQNAYPVSFEKRNKVYAIAARGVCTLLGLTGKFTFETVEFVDDVWCFSLPKTDEN
jgi:hypothetical protein